MTFVGRFCTIRIFFKNAVNYLEEAGLGGWSRHVQVVSIAGGVEL